MAERLSSVVCVRMYVDVSACHTNGSTDAGRSRGSRPSSPNPPGKSRRACHVSTTWKARLLADSSTFLQPRERPSGSPVTAQTVASAKDSTVTATSVPSSASAGVPPPRSACPAQPSNKPPPSTVNTPPDTPCACHLSAAVHIRPRLSHATSHALSELEEVAALSVPVSAALSPLSPSAAPARRSVSVRGGTSGGARRGASRPGALELDNR
mmetsp:Transcript_26715/g.87615  ORF Transcript_26715/g.87615 Transcript_26715/m.87615 type:complete len:211 (+) Transcript_26715:1949-2581(+)